MTEWMQVGVAPAGIAVNGPLLVGPSTVYVEVRHACEDPERPPDGNTRWHLTGCRGCRIKAEAMTHPRTHPGGGPFYSQRKWAADLLVVMDSFEAHPPHHHQLCTAKAGPVTVCGDGHHPWAS